MRAEERAAQLLAQQQASQWQEDMDEVMEALGEQDSSLLDLPPLSAEGGGSSGVAPMGIGDMPPLGAFSMPPSYEEEGQYDPISTDDWPSPSMAGPSMASPSRLGSSTGWDDEGLDQLVEEHWPGM